MSLLVPVGKLFLAHLGTEEWFFVLDSLVRIDDGGGRVLPREIATSNSGVSIIGLSF